MKKRILVACGAGIATSTVVCTKLEELIKNNNIEAEIVQCKIAECASKQDEADLIVTTTILPTTYKIPAIKATSYITGINVKATEEKILEVLRG
ncbi:PTS galactitol transporter subunit IIB [Peptacetobacter hominis]|uniref:PTS galactitol transporter subunit IIB n=1 Tax=Peptacetobacter hominis TaxID=2743610 RepID=A0A544QYS3_9FIRM|nr:PTS sugar transporter subunit IIB [Peptacetobacter hominis]TQQ85800.1 PTS galactitol transporter subunit IIB [Peptacetobacter hominis]